MKKITKADIERARNAYWLKEAQMQIGPHIKTLKQVKIVSRAKKPRYSLGKTLAKQSKKFNMGGYKKK